MESEELYYSMYIGQYRTFDYAILLWRSKHDAHVMVYCFSYCSLHTIVSQPLYTPLHYGVP